MQWNFPGGEGLTPYGHNDSGIDTFSNNIANSLTREIIQNSMDTHDDTVSDPVKVVFRSRSIKTKDISGIEDFLENALAKAKLYWSKLGAAETVRFLADIEAELDNETVDVLTVSDYNTIGLNKKNYASLIDGGGYFEKTSTDAAGSKGIGKAAPFAASNIRMVFYDSYSTDRDRRFAGTINFVPYLDEDRGDNFITQTRGKIESDTKSLLISSTERTKFCTDIHIIGLKRIDFWK